MDICAPGSPWSSRLYRETWIKPNDDPPPGKKPSTVPTDDDPTPDKHDGRFDAEQRCGIGVTIINNTVSKEVPIEVFDFNGN